MNPTPETAGETMNEHRIIDKRRLALRIRPRTRMRIGCSAALICSLLLGSTLQPTPATASSALPPADTEASTSLAVALLELHVDSLAVSNGSQPPESDIERRSERIPRAIRGPIGVSEPSSAKAYTNTETTMSLFKLVASDTGTLPPHPLVLIAYQLGPVDAAVCLAGTVVPSLTVYCLALRLQRDWDELIVFLRDEFIPGLIFDVEGEPLDQLQQIFEHLGVTPGIGLAFDAANVGIIFGARQPRRRGATCDFLDSSGRCRRVHDR